MLEYIVKTNVHAPGAIVARQPMTVGNGRVGNGVEKNLCKLEADIYILIHNHMDAETGA